MTQYSDITGQVAGSQPGSGSGPGQPGQGSGSGEPPASSDGPPATPPAVSWPSPYLPEGQAVPEAYPAPAQPGQPRYGAAPGAVLPGQAFSPGQPGYPTRPGQGQPGHSQPGYHPGYGQPGYGQPQPPYQRRPTGRRGAAARTGLRDPALAAAWERLVASIVDWLLILAAAFLALAGPMLALGREVDAVLVNARSLSPTAAQAAFDNVLQSPSTTRTLMSFWLIAFAIALAYYWVLQAVWGATLGKRALGLRVVTSADRLPVGVRAAGIRTGAFLLGPAILMLVPGAVDLLGGLLWIADCASAIADPGGRCLHDRLAGTAVVRKRSLS